MQESQVWSNLGDASSNILRYPGHEGGSTSRSRDAARGKCANHTNTDKPANFHLSLAVPQPRAAHDFLRRRPPQTVRSWPLSLSPITISPPRFLLTRTDRLLNPLSDTQFGHPKNKFKKKVKPDRPILTWPRQRQHRPPCPSPARQPLLLLRTEPRRSPPMRMRSKPRRTEACRTTRNSDGIFATRYTRSV